MVGIAQDAQRLRQPHEFPARQKADDESGLLRRRGAARGFARRFHLKQRQPGVIEENAARHNERDPPRAALQQFHADLEFQIADLTAERR